MDFSFLDTLDSRRTRLLMLRHAEREEITDMRFASLALLTDKGKADARELGRRLAGSGGRVTLFHSPVRRCEETAEAIRAGIREKSGQATWGGALSWLGGDFITADADFTNDFINQYIASRGHLDFLRDWFDGKLPPAVVRPLPEAARIELGFLAEQLKTESGLVIDISHDWNMMLLIEHYLGLRHEDIGLPLFLACLAVSGGDGARIDLEYRGKRVHAEI